MSDNEGIYTDNEQDGSFEENEEAWSDEDECEDLSDDDECEDLSDDDECEDLSDEDDINKINTVKDGIKQTGNVCNPIASQFELFDGLMAMRMGQQEMLMNVNKLPQTRTYQNFKRNVGDLFVSTTKGVKRCLEEILDNALELQKKLMESDNIGHNAKRQKLNDFGMDEEIVSDEENDENMDADEEGDGEDEEEGDEDNVENDEDEGDDDEDEGDEDEAITQKQNVKDISNFKNICKNVEELINERHETMKEYRIHLLKELSEKVKFAPSSNKQGDFKSLSVPINKQINQILEKKEALRDRTQIKRLVYKVLGKDVDQVMKDDNTAEGNSKFIVARDEEIFDDYDFYCRLMTDLTNRKISSTRDMVEISRRWAELSRLKSKSIKKFLVDQKASKGRKTRYNIIKRLIGLNDIELATPLDNKECDAIFNQIFRQNENGNGQSWLFKPVA